MYEAAKVFFRSTVVIGFAGLNWACAAGVDLVDAGRVTVKTEDVRAAYVVLAEVHEENGDTVIFGRVNPGPSVPRTVGLTGHVDIRITAADGTLIEQHHASLERVLGHRLAKRQVRFRVEVSTRLPRGAIVTVNYVERHDGKFF